MRLIGLSLLQGFGSEHPEAMQPLAALAATIRAPGIRNSAMLETQLGGMIAGKDAGAIRVDLPEAGCRVMLRINEGLETVRVVAVTLLDSNRKVE